MTDTPKDKAAEDEESKNQLRGRISDALEVAWTYGGIDGAHHKDWIIDQMVRALLGNVKYLEWVHEYEHGDDQVIAYEWETGIAP